MTTSTADSDQAQVQATEGGDAALSDSQPSGRPSFTITEAATACAVSRKTITRKLSELADAGAAKDADGIWRIPVEALLAVGLHPGRSVAPGAVRREPVVDLRSVSARPTPAEPAAPETITVPRDRWDDLRIRLARAEAESVERGRALDDARLALRALTAGPTPSEPVSLDPSAVVAERLTVSAPVMHPAVPPAHGLPEANAGVAEPPTSVSLPPTPVPLTLGADSSVWDTLLPRPATAPPAVPPSVPPATAPVMPAPAAAQSAYQPTQHFTLAEPPATGQVVAAPRRRWWGGKR